MSNCSDCIYYMLDTPHPTFAGVCACSKNKVYVAELNSCEYFEKDVFRYLWSVRYV